MCMSEFSAEISINPKSGLGLDVELLAGRYVVVKRVQLNGSVDNWNSKSPLGLQICRGDRIDRINGATDHTAIIKLVLNLNTKHIGFKATVSYFIREMLRGTFTRGMPLTLHLEPPLGVRVRSHFGGMHLGITSVGNGSVKDWNDDHPEEKIGPGDAIVAINDLLCLASTLEEALDCALDEIKVTFLRYNSSNEFIRTHQRHNNLSPSKRKMVRSFSNTSQPAGLLSF